MFGFLDLAKIIFKEFCKGFIPEKSLLSIKLNAPDSIPVPSLDKFIASLYIPSTSVETSLPNPLKAPAIPKASGLLLAISLTLFIKFKPFNE